VEQPFKIPFVAAVVILINKKKPEAAEQVLEKAQTIIQGYLNVGDWREVKLVLRFLACLQGILEGDGVFPILEELFNRAVDLQTASSEDVSILSPYIQLTAILPYAESRIGTREGHSPDNSLPNGILRNWFRRASACTAREDRCHSINASRSPSSRQSIPRQRRGRCSRGAERNRYATKTATGGIRPSVGAGVYPTSLELASEKGG